MTPDITPNHIRWRFYFAWLVRRTLLIVILVLALALLYLRMVGVPGWARTRILDALNRGPYVVDVASARWSVSRGIILRKVAIHQKGVVGSPAVQAREIFVRLDLGDLLDGRIVINTVTIRDSVVSPSFTSSGAATSSATSMGSLDWSLRLLLERSEFLGVKVNRFTADMAYEKGRLAVENIAGEVSGPHSVRPGRLLTGSAYYESTNSLLKGEVTAELDPNILAPLYLALNLRGMHRFVQRFDIQGASTTYRLEFSKDCRSGGPFNIKGRVGLQDFTYRDVPISRADAYVDMIFSRTNSQLIVDPLYALRPEGHSQARLAVNFTQPAIEFSGLSHFDPTKLIHMLGIFPDSRLADMSFAGPVTLTATGRVDLAGSRASEIQLKADFQDLTWKKLALKHVTFDLIRHGRTNDLSNLVCEAYGGTLEANGRVIQPATNTAFASYAVTGSFDGVELASLVRIKRPEDNSMEGKLGGELYLEGLIGRGQSASTLGYGNVRIRDGKVFMLPIFGGLSKIMTDLIPGLNFLIGQDDATMDFTVSKSRVHFREMTIEGDILSLRCDKGSLGFDKTIDGYIRLTLMKEHTLLAKLLKPITYLPSKLLEFRVTGTLQDPRWYPTNFSKDLLEKLGLD